MAPFKSSLTACFAFIGFTVAACGSTNGNSNPQDTGVAKMPLSVTVEEDPAQHFCVTGNWAITGSIAEEGGTRPVSYSGYIGADKCDDSLVVSLVPSVTPTYSLTMSNLICLQGLVQQVPGSDAGSITWVPMPVGGEGYVGCEFVSSTPNPFAVISDQVVSITINVSLGFAVPIIAVSRTGDLKVGVSAEVVPNICGTEFCQDDQRCLSVDSAAPACYSECDASVSPPVCPINSQHPCISVSTPEAGAGGIPPVGQSSVWVCR